MRKERLQKLVLCAAIMIIPLMTAAAQPVETAVENPAETTLLERTKTLCRGYAEGFMSPATDLAYGKRLNGPRGLDVLESPAEVARGRVHGDGVGENVEERSIRHGIAIRNTFIRLEIQRVGATGNQPGFVLRGQDQRLVEGPVKRQRREA